MILFANARMYALVPVIRDAWSELFRWVATKAGIPIDILDYPPPAPLEELWHRSDLALVFMCGWPFAHRSDPVELIAAPVPAPERYGGRPIYFTDLVVRADSPIRTLADANGARLGFTTINSHSGYNAPRHHLWQWQRKQSAIHFDTIVGPLVTPRGVLEALLEDRIDIGPLDSYAHDLLKRNMPELVGKIRTITVTDPAPIPPLVATARHSQAQLIQIRNALSRAISAPELAQVRECLCLQGFAFPKAADYRLALHWEKEMADAQYPQLTAL